MSEKNDDLDAFRKLDLSKQPREQPKKKKPKAAVPPGDISNLKRSCDTCEVNAWLSNEGQKTENNPNCKTCLEAAEELPLWVPLGMDPGAYYREHGISTTKPKGQPVPEQIILTPGELKTKIKQAIKAHERLFRRAGKLKGDDHEEVVNRLVKNLVEFIKGGENGSQ